MIYTLMSVYLFAHATTSARGGCSSLCSLEADLRDTRLKRTVLRAADCRVAYVSVVLWFFFPFSGAFDRLSE